MKINKFILIGLAAVVVIGVAAFFIIQSNSNAAKDSQYETVSLERGDLTASVGATGTVRSVQSAELSWQTNGIVEKVAVKIGDNVKADAVLASLVQTSMSQAVIMAEADLITAQNELDDLMNSSASLSQAQQKLAQAKQALEDAQEKVDSISFQRASDNLILQTQANTDLARKEVALAADNYHRYEHRPDGDSTKATALLRLTTARQNLTDLVNLYNWYTGKPTELDKETYYADLAFAKSDLADAQREYDRLAGGPPESDIAAAKARITAAQSTINMGKIISPFDGVVTQVDAMAGDLINQGVFAIRVDDTSKLLVDLQISEVDVNSLKVDQEVTVSFDAVQGKTYLGKVQQISQYGSSTGTGVNFDVTVELTDNDEFIKPGMTAAVTITVKDIKGALFVQNRAVRNVNGQRVVYVLKDGVAVPVEIRLGATADTVSEVVGGELVEGDLIILNPPSTDQGMFGG